MPIYQNLYNIIIQYVYGTEVLDNFQQLVATEIATIGSLLMVALPVVCILWITKSVLSLTSRW